MKYPAALIISVCLLTTTSPAAPDNDSKTPDPVVIRKLEEIVKLRDRIAESAKLELELGRGDSLNEAFVKLAEAKLELASEKGNQEGIISALETIVQFRQHELDREISLAEDDRRTQEEIGHFRIKLLKAEIRLHRAKTKYGIE